MGGSAVSVRADKDRCCGKFCAAHLSLKVSFVIHILSGVLHLVGLATPVWTTFTYVTGGNTGYQGIWNHCFNSNGFVCCGTIGDYYDVINNSIPTWLTAVRVLVLVAMATGLATTIATGICSFKSFQMSTGLVSSILSLVTGAVMLSAVIVYAVGADGFTWSSSTNYHFSFAVTVIATVGYLVAGVLIIIGMCTAVCVTIAETPQ